MASQQQKKTIHLFTPFVVSSCSWCWKQGWLVLKGWLVQKVASLGSVSSLWHSSSWGWDGQQHCPVDESV
jgi:hypothetical protein